MCDKRVMSDDDDDDDGYTITPARVVDRERAREKFVYFHGSFVGSLQAFPRVQPEPEKKTTNKSEKKRGDLKKETRRGVYNTVGWNILETVFTYRVMIDVVVVSGCAAVRTRAHFWRSRD